MARNGDEGSTEMFGGRARERWILASLSGVLNGIRFFIYLGEASLVANVPLLYALVCSRSYWESASLSAWVGFLGGVHIWHHQLRLVSLAWLQLIHSKPNVCLWRPVSIALVRPKAQLECSVGRLYLGT